jgi:hypothetical protein
MLGSTLVLGIWLASEPVTRGQEKPSDEKKGQSLAREVAAVREKGLDWLTKNQAAHGSWGKSYTIGITSMACLAYLSAADEPFTGERGKALVKGLQFLLDNPVVSWINAAFIRILAHDFIADLAGGQPRRPWKPACFLGPRPFFLLRSTP